VQCVILAGGLGTRMRPVTAALPKALLPVGGRPFAEWQLRWLSSQGVTDVVFSIGHLGHLIREFVGDGAAWDLAVRYVDEGGQLRGTGGAVRLALDEGVLEESFFVLYGDSYLSVDLGAVEQAFGATPAAALMTVYRNDGRFDRSNAVFSESMVTRYDKRATLPPPDMRFIDYGLSVLRRQVVDQRIPAGTVLDLADVYSRLSADRLLAGYEVKERFYEVGSVQGRADLEALLSAPDEPVG